ncbi:type VI secretion system tip protein VgrG [Xenorhabdus sp. M]|uniref:Type VI secretion system tip protein VgrG n=1 Tax=Xenorhabdus szentirmaii TaxID=290112 RepID=A0AAW3YXB1_9GAMM|nr:type VI secretion system tip protein VgrG [Xenorhabdus sp. M]MBD2802137.1 type VI secretion system tip protein VgrG [Xenorhabdus sp. M]
MSELSGDIIAISKALLDSLNRYQLQVQGCDTELDVESFTGREAMSDTYRYRILFTSADQDIPPQQMLRRSTALTYRTPGKTEFGTRLPPEIRRVVHGVVTDFKRLGGSRDEALYQIILEPKFSLLRHQKRSYRFFLNQSVPEIVEHILREHGFKGWEFEFNLKHTYPKREQINQANESDRAFIERLLADVGIFYTFRLQPDTETEVIHFGDKQRCYEFGKNLPLNSPSGMSDNGQDSVWGLTLRHQVVERSVQTKDYNYRTAQHILNSGQADMTRGEGEGMTYGDVTYYKLRHLSSGDKLRPETETANFWARLDHERFLSRQTLLHAQSTDPTLMAGQVLTIEDATTPSTLPAVFQSPVLVTHLRFSASRATALQVSLTAVPFSESLCWRPPLKPRPVLSGTLTARVTSPINSDIYAHQSQSGQYWVKFDADRDEKRPGYESMPMRLAKPYAGDTYGIHFPLIQGTEVAIAFHEGDPDRPYIAHALHDSYHPDHVAARNHTRNVIRTPANNKLRMEDKRGQEHVKLSTEYGGKSQLNLGHLVNAKQEKRGEGFELRTDSWGVIRAGKGLFISADKKDRAQSDVLDMREAITLVKGAVNQVSNWGSITESHHNLQPDAKSLKSYLENVDRLKVPAMLLSAPDGVGVVSPDIVLLQSGKSLYAQSVGEVHISSEEKVGINAKNKISLLSQTEGVRLVSGKGHFEIESHADRLTTTALKDITIQSTQGHIQITAKNGITLGSGGAYVRISPDGQIEIHGPSNLSLKGNHIWDGPEGQEFPLPELPQSVCKECLQKAQEQAAGLLIRE